MATNLKDENFKVKHNKKGMLCNINYEPNTKGSIVILLVFHYLALA